MSKVLSLSLRTRVLAAVFAGASHRTAAERFGVSAVSVSRWRSLSRGQGVHARSPGRCPAFCADRAHAETILHLVEATPAITIEELRREVSSMDLAFGYGTLQRFLIRHDMTPEERLGMARHWAAIGPRTMPSEQDRPDVLTKRRAWFETQPDLDPSRLVFIPSRRLHAIACRAGDEIWVKTNMTRTYGRSRCAERLRMGAPHSHWNTTTFNGALTLSGMRAPCFISGPINRVAFEAYVEYVLAPKLRPSDVVVMENLSSYKGPHVQELIEAAGATLMFLPPYSPDFNPIENAFAKTKALLRKAAEQIVEGLWSVIGRIVDMVTPTECGFGFLGHIRLGGLGQIGWCFNDLWAVFGGCYHLKLYDRLLLLGWFSQGLGSSVLVFANKTF